MKNKKLHKVVLIVGILTLLSIISKIINESYTDSTRLKFKCMKSPVILKMKTKSTFWYNVDLLDGNGDLYHFGNVSDLANEIGENYQINDTIKK